MKVCVARGGVSVINLGRAIEYDDYDETMNVAESVVTGELTIPKLTAYMVEEGIDEAGWDRVGYMPRHILFAVVKKDDMNMDDVSQYNE